MRPTNWSTTAPSRTANTAGMPSTGNCAATAGFSSVLTFATTTRPPNSSATLARSGDNARHGGHHGAQKSTTTGTSCDRPTTAASNSSSDTSNTLADLATATPGGVVGKRTHC